MDLLRHHKNISLIILIGTISIILLTQSVNANGADESSDFPWSMFLTVIVNGEHESCQINQCKTKTECLKSSGYWSDDLDICSAYTSYNYILAGSWKDQWDETVLTYYPDGTFEAINNAGEPFIGGWVPISSNKVISYQMFGSLAITTKITLLNNTTYIYPDVPDWGQFTRTSY